MTTPTTPVVAVTPWSDPPSHCSLCGVQAPGFLFVQMAHQTPRGGRFGNTVVCPHCFAVALKLFVHDDDVPAAPTPITVLTPAASS